jgi:Ca2+-binding EF-hand superfamily protein
MLRERFDRIDANSDGVLDEAELKQMFERLREGADRPRRD